MPCWLAIEIPDSENYYIDGYVLKGASSGIYYDDWTFQYSDDGSTWYDLDSITDGGLKDANEHDFNVRVHKAHKYYRWYFTKAPVSWPGLGTANLYGYNAEDVIIPTPTPSPEPTATPSPAPTATPTPGGGTVPTPGGGSSSGGDNSGNGSNISGGDDEGLFGWLWDLLKDLVKAILKAIFGILSTILGFLIWIVERVGLLLPFLPAPAIAALGAGVVLIFVIRIIRFIRG